MRGEIFVRIFTFNQGKSNGQRHVTCMGEIGNIYKILASKHIKLKCK